jgi:hypothetical protein
MEDVANSIFSITFWSDAAMMLWNGICFKLNMVLVYIYS